MQDGSRTHQKENFSLSPSDEGRRKGSYLLGLEHGSVVIGIEDFHDGRSRGAGAVPIHVRGLDGQRVLGDPLRRRAAWEATASEAQPWVTVGDGACFSSVFSGRLTCRSPDCQQDHRQRAGGMWSQTVGLALGEAWALPLDSADTEGSSEQGFEQSY